MQFTHRFREEFPECSVKSVTSIAGWTSPIDEITSMATNLFDLGLIDVDGRAQIKNMDSETAKAILEKKYADANKKWSHT